MVYDNRGWREEKAGQESAPATTKESIRVRTGVALGLGSLAG